MRIALVFPPLFANIVQPHAAMPRLAAVLGQAGHEARVFDLNLAYVRWLVGGAGWATVQPLLDAEWQRLEAAEILEPDEQRAYLELAWAAGRPAEEIRRTFAAAFALLRDPVSGTIWDDYRHAMAIVGRFWTLLARAAAIRDQPADSPLGSYYGRAAAVSSADLLRRLAANREDAGAKFYADQVASS